MDFSLPPLYLAGYSSFKIDKQIFISNMTGVNVKNVSGCQYDILQKQNTI